jgi:hypothetical protein
MQLVTPTKLCSASPHLQRGPRAEFRRAGCRLRYCTSPTALCNSLTVLSFERCALRTAIPQVSGSLTCVQLPIHGNTCSRPIRRFLMAFSRLHLSRRCDLKILKQHIRNILQARHYLIKLIRHTKACTIQLGPYTAKPLVQPMVVLATLRTNCRNVGLRYPASRQDLHRPLFRRLESRLVILGTFTKQLYSALSFIRINRGIRDPDSESASSGLMLACAIARQ